MSSSSPAIWTCHRCTLINPTSSSTCMACGNAIGDKNISSPFEKTKGRRRSHEEEEEEEEDKKKKKKKTRRRRRRVDDAEQEDSLWDSRAYDANTSQLDKIIKKKQQQQQRLRDDGDDDSDVVEIVMKADKPTKMTATTTSTVLSKKLKTVTGFKGLDWDDPIDDDVDNVNNHHNHPKPKKKSSLKQPTTTPQSIDDLKILMDSKKIDELRGMLEYALSTNRGAIRFFSLQGPVGCGKSTAVRVIARELGATIREWDSETLPPSTFSSLTAVTDSSPHDTSVQYMSQSSDFIRFIRSAAYPTLLMNAGGSRNIVLLESIPTTATRDHDIVTATLVDVAYRLSQGDCACAIVHIMSGDEISPTDINNVLGQDLVQLTSSFRIVHFNSIPPGRLTRALERVGGLNKTHALAVAEQSRGDARSAFGAMAFQTIAIGEKPDKTRPDMARDASYSMLHGVGKLIAATVDPTTGQAGFIPELVAESCNLEPDALMAFVHENFHHYVDEMDDAVRVTELLSMADAFWGLRWRVIDRNLLGQDNFALDVDACGAYANSLVSRVSLGGIRHRVKPSAMVQIRKPQMFECARTTRERLQVLARAPSAFVDRRTLVVETLPWGEVIGWPTHVNGLQNDDRLALSMLDFSQMRVSRDNAVFRQSTVKRSGSYIVTTAAPANHNNNAVLSVEDKDDPIES